jgi:phosphoglycerate dehydrogenase-like enzyme
MFAPEMFARLQREHEVIAWNGEDRQEFYARHLPQAEVLVSQQGMDRTALDLAPGLRVIFNVETNFLPNIDYETSFARGIHVLAPSAVFALPVAEIGLGMALSLARGIHSGHGDFQAGREAYGLEANQDAELLRGAKVGFVGFGDLGRALHRVLAGFSPEVQVYDPWLPEGHLRRAGVAPVGFEAVMAENRFIFVVASITTENEHLIDAQALGMMQPGAMLILLSRAAVADFAALREAAGSGRIRGATDVVPDEPVAADDPIRNTPGMLLSAHKAGALAPALQEIGARVVEDIDLISRGLPPVACRRAERETVMRLRSKPVEGS